MTQAQWPTAAERGLLPLHPCPHTAAASFESAVALVSPYGEIAPAGKPCVPKRVSSFLNTFEVFEKFENSYFCKIAFHQKLSCYGIRQVQC